ncbi:hypothetical protein BC938DRAFT_474378 [Jimgerdemannia flammicorona]|uniref:Uncharacterized protein n=1 Tax=Jimgerdemannia flammicorona TaxID=994334 RepID=A0A433QSJ9_9FUNG|nr:hypothetical protein BC938DRAFT_474378 [Jimgerdemannia flammicorona]
MTAMEQEIERKKQFLVHEQALLIKQEDDLRARREKLQTLGNTITGLPNDSPLMTSPTYLVDEDETTSASASAASASTVILPGIGLGIVNESAAASPPHPLDARTPGFSTPTTSAAGSTTLSPPPQHSTPLMGPLYSQTRLRVPSDVSGHSSAGSWSDIGFGLVTPDPLLGGATPSIDGTTLSVGGFEDEGSVRGSIVSEVLGSPSLGGSEVGLEGSEDFVEIEEEELIERARWR